jgi:hypothetical protein
LTNVKPEHSITVAIIITRHQSVGVLFVRADNGLTISGSTNITGSIDITGQFLVNGSPITGSGGSVDTSSLATTGSNTFIGDQTITGSLAMNDSATNFLIEGNGFSQTYLTSNGAIILNPGYGGVEMVGSYKTFRATDITADGFVSGEIRATNNVVSSSQQIIDYNTFALTSSANTFYAAQSVTNGAGNTSNVTPLGVSNVDTSGGMGQTKNISLSANPSSLGGPLSGWTEPTLYGLGNAGPYQIAEFQSQGNYTDGTVSFKKSLVVTGSVNVTGDFLVNGSPITGSGGTIATGSFATTGSNTFNGDQTITGSIAMNDVSTSFLIEGNGFGQTYMTAGGAIVLNPGYGGVEMVGSYRELRLTDVYATGEVSSSTVQTSKIESAGNILLQPDTTDPRYLNVYNTAAQDTHITASGGYLYLGDDTTYVNVNNYGTDYNIFVRADNGLHIDADTKVTGSLGVSGSIILTGSLLMTGSATFINNGPSTFNGDTVISTIDSLPSGTPGQIAFQGGKMWVFIGGTWNEVSFVAPAPSSYEYSMGYDASSSGSACGGSPSNFYSNTLTLGVGEFLWTGPGLATKVNNGYYASSSIVYVVTGGDGEITETGSCPIPHFYSPVGYNSTDSASACGDSSSEFYSPCSSIAVGCRLSPGSAMIGAMNDGFYALSGSWFEVTGGDGVISDTGTCS